MSKTDKKEKRFKVSDMLQGPKRLENESYEDYKERGDDRVSGKQAELKKLKEELATLMETGSLSDYAEAMTRKLKRIDKCHVQF